MRPVLIQDTVDFLQTFFLKKIATRKIDVGAAHTWFQAANPAGEQLQPQPGTLTGDISLFFERFVDLLLPSNVEAKIPDTFMFDEERISKLRSDILNPINLDICIHLFRDIQTSGVTSETRRILAASTSPWSPLSTPPHSPRSSICYRPSLSPITPSEAQQKTKHDAISNKTTQSTKEGLPNDESWRTAANTGAANYDSGSASISQRTSFSSATSLPLRTSEFPWRRESPPDEDRLRQEIMAIVDDTPGSSRWQQSVPAIALHLARSTSSLDNLSYFESQLPQHLSNIGSSIFQTSENTVVAQFKPLLAEFVTRYCPLTTTQIFEAATSSGALPCQLPRPKHELADTAKQIAHIGILHWRVWAPLAYKVDPDADNYSEKSAESDVVDNNTEVRRPQTAAQCSGDSSPVRDPDPC